MEKLTLGAFSDYVNAPKNRLLLFKETSGGMKHMKTLCGHNATFLRAGVKPVCMLSPRHSRRDCSCVLNMIPTCSCASSLCVGNDDFWAVVAVGGVRKFASEPAPKPFKNTAL